MVTLSILSYPMFPFWPFYISYIPRTDAFGVASFYDANLGIHMIADIHYVSFPEAIGETSLFLKDSSQFSFCILFYSPVVVGLVAAPISV